MFRKILKILFFTLFAFIAISAQSQDDCKEKIAEAEKLFDEGKYSLVIEKLDNVLEDCNLKGNKKYEVFKYLAAANYELDELESADKYMILFLKKNPYYETNLSNDPIVFIERLDYYKKWPILEIGLSGGLPFNNIIIDSIFPVLDSTVADYNQEFTTTSAFSLSFNILVNFNSYLALGTGATITQQTIAQTIPMFEGINFNYSEKMQQLSAPLYVKFSYPVKKFIPSVYIGGELIYTLKSEYYYEYAQSGTFDEKYDFLIAQRKRSDVLLDMNTERNQIRYAGIAGAQIAYKMKKLTLFANFKYRKELNYFNKPEARYSNPDLYITNYYIFPDIRFDTYEATIGFTYSLFYKVKSKY